MLQQMHWPFLLAGHIVKIEWTVIKTTSCSHKANQIYLDFSVALFMLYILGHRQCVRTGPFSLSTK